MQTTAIRQHPSPQLTRIAALATLIAAFAAGSAWADDSIGNHSVAARIASAGLADLEGAFWICDYRATARGAANGDIAVCTAVYEAVKARKFGGDFDKLLEWWREHKTARHDVLATLEGAPARR